MKKKAFLVNEYSRRGVILDVPKLLEAGINGQTSVIFQETDERNAIRTRQHEEDTRCLEIITGWGMGKLHVSWRLFLTQR